MNTKHCIVSFLLTSLVALPALAAVSVQTKDMDCSPTGQNWRRLGFLLNNTGSENVNMANLALEYDFKEVPNAFGSAVWYYYVHSSDSKQQGGTTNEVTISIESHADYNTLRLTFNSRILPAGGQAEVQFGLHNHDWSMIDETQDPSYIQSCSYVANPGVGILDVFDVHFTELFDTSPESHPITGRPPGNLIEPTDFQREIDILNAHFRDENGDAIILFRYKDATRWSEIPAALKNPGPSQDPCLAAATPYDHSAFTAAIENQICNQPLVYDPHAINFFINQDPDGNSHGRRATAAAGPYVLLDYNRLSHTTQAPEEHEMGHAFGLGTFCNNWATSPTNDNTNIMTHQGTSSYCNSKCGGMYNISGSSGGNRSLGFTLTPDSNMCDGEGQFEWYSEYQPDGSYGQVDVILMEAERAKAILR